MAELKKNDLWKDIEKESEAAQDKILGPSFDYTATTVPPSAKGVSDDGNIGQVFTNAGAIGSYVNDLIFGGNDPYGNAMFVQTGGMCKAPGGTDVPRWSYVNNKLSGQDGMPPSVASAMGGMRFNGILPGMFGDIAALNPTKTMNALKLDGVPPCELYQCGVTDAIGNGIGAQRHFIVPQFEQNLKYCIKVTDPNAVKELEDEEAKKIDEKKKKDLKEGKKDLENKLKNMKNFGVTTKVDGDKSKKVKNISPVLDAPTDTQKDACTKCAESKSSKKEEFKQDNFFPFVQKKYDTSMFIVPFKITSEYFLGFAFIIFSMIFVANRYFKKK